MTGERKSRLSGMFKKKDREFGDDRPPIDSAYGSSEPQTEAPSSYSESPDMVPVDRDSEIQGNMNSNDRDKNLALKPSTGEVIDRDTGNVITVVTTTTTTTTTTMNAAGKQIGQEVKEDVTQKHQPGGSGQTPAEMPANNSRDPNVSESTTSVSATNKSTVPLGSSSLQPQSNDNSGAPVLPARSPNRKSGEYARDTSGDQQYESGGRGAQNFSYPSRGGTGAGMDQGIMTTGGPQQHNAGAMSNLKAAAKGIHGVGETLRGTFNSSIDRRLPPKDAEAQAALNAKNQAVLDRGRAEMDGIYGQPGNYGSSSNAPSNYGNSGYTPSGGHGTSSGAPLREEYSAPTPPPKNDDYGDESYYDDEPGNQRRSGTGLSKLFKRKPVSGGSSGEERRRY